MKQNELFTTSHIEGLKNAFSSIETINPDRLPEFHAMYDKMNDAQLSQLAEAGIKFLSSLARNECVRRGLIQIPQHEWRARRR